MFAEVKSSDLSAIDHEAEIEIKVGFCHIRRFYGKITGNRLPVHFALSFAGARKHFQESGTER